MKSFKNYFLRYVAILIFVLTATLVSGIAFAEGAEKINDIQIDVLLNDDGSANITQVWDIETHKGTEFYITMSQMGDMEVQNFRVKDETGKEFTFIGEWDTSASIEEKAYKNGFNPTKDGFEMCWGKGSYGKHTYTLSYTLTNLVKSYPDSDGFNTRLINDKMSPNVEHATVWIRFADEAKNPSVNPEQMGAWAFGHQGKVAFENGAVFIRTTAPITESDYLNAMIRLDKNILQPISKGKGSFEELKERAFKDSDYMPSKKKGAANIIGAFAAFVLIGILGKFLDKNKNAPLRKSFRKMGGKRKVEGYSRRLPFDGKLYTTYAVMKKIGLKCSARDLFKAYILKLIQRGVVTVKTKTDGKNTVSEFWINPYVEISDPNEKDLLDTVLLGAAGSNIVPQNGKVQVSEYEIHSGLKMLPEWFSEWEAEVIRSGGNDFVDSFDGLDYEQAKISKKFMEVLSPQGLEEANKILQFKNFLQDFTIIQEREMKEVELWDDYLVFAALFQMAEKVAQQMHALDPYFAQRSAVLASDHKKIGFLLNSADRLYTSASKGSGGSSSSGGGDGYSGGGSGGGSR